MRRVQAPGKSWDFHTVHWCLSLTAEPFIPQDCECLGHFSPLHWLLHGINSVAARDCRRASVGVSSSPLSAHIYIMICSLSCCGPSWECHSTAQHVSVLYHSGDLHEYCSPVRKNKSSAYSHVWDDTFKPLETHISRFHAMTTDLKLLQHRQAAWAQWNESSSCCFPSCVSLCLRIKKIKPMAVDADDVEAEQTKKQINICSPLMLLKPLSKTGDLSCGVYPSAILLSTCRTEEEF